MKTQCKNRLSAEDNASGKILSDTWSRVVRAFFNLAS